MSDSFEGEIPFSEWLREQSEPAWEEATRHRFVEELGDDAIDDEVFRRYLVQDYAFLELGARTTALAVSQAPSMEEMRRLSQQLSVLTGGENDYTVGCTYRNTASNTEPNDRRYQPARHKLS